MTPLRQRMLDAMALRGLAARTMEAYIHAVIGLSRHYRCSPEVLTARQVQDYMLHLHRERKLSFSTVNQAASAFKFLYGTVLGLDLRQQFAGVARGEGGGEVFLDGDLLAFVVDRQVHHAKAAGGELSNHPVAADDGVRWQGRRLDL